MGGRIDLKFFFGNKPEEVIKAYHAYINGFALTSFWTHGFHLCRWGFKDSIEWREVWRNATNYGIPLDAMWTDIDYMKDYINFSIDTEKFIIEDMK